jgi:hypothetical protein
MFVISDVLGTYYKMHTLSWLKKMVIPFFIKKKKMGCHTILLECGGIQWGYRTFKFENMWFKADGFVDKVRLWWSSYQFQGSPSFIFAQKLKALKVDLKRWNEQKFGNVETLKKARTEEFSALDRLEEEHGLAPKEKVRKCLVFRDLEYSIL